MTSRPCSTALSILDRTLLTPNFFCRVSLLLPMTPTGRKQY